MANSILPWTKLSDIKNSKDAGELLAGYVHQCGCMRGVLYGNYYYEPDDRPVVRAVGVRMRQLKAPLLEVLHVDHSAYDGGWAGINEPGEGLQKNLLGEEFKTGMITGSKPGDVAKVLKEIVSAKENDENVSEHTDRYRIREDEPPMKTGVGYKVFLLKAVLKAEGRGDRSGKTASHTEGRGSRSYESFRREAVDELFGGWRRSGLRSFRRGSALFGGG